jgi:hypothetical protein
MGIGNPSLLKKRWLKNLGECFRFWETTPQPFGREYGDSDLALHPIILPGSWLILFRNPNNP